jgi:ASC-1-like (ASCH) protein
MNSIFKLSPLLILIVTISCAHRKINGEKEKEVRVSDWGRRILIIGDEVLDSAKTSIINQIGEKEYEAFKKKYTLQSWPSQMRYDLTAVSRDSILRKKVYSKLDALRMYKIATFRNMLGGTFRANLIILKIPYSRNEAWDRNAKWDSTYFVFRKEHVIEL